MFCLCTSSRSYTVSKNSKNQSSNKRYQDTSKNVNEELNNQKSKNEKNVDHDANKNLTNGNTIVGHESSRIEENSKNQSTIIQQQDEPIAPSGDNNASATSGVNQTTILPQPDKQTEPSRDKNGSVISVLHQTTFIPQPDKETKPNGDNNGSVNRDTQIVKESSSVTVAGESEPQGFTNAHTEDVETPVNQNTISESTSSRSTSKARSSHTVTIEHRETITNGTSTESISKTIISSANPEGSQTGVSINVTKVKETEPEINIPHKTHLLTVPQPTSVQNTVDERKVSVGTLLSHGQTTATVEVNRRRSGVQVTTPNALVGALPVYEKSQEDQDKIKHAIEANEFLSKVISGKCLNDIINAMQLRKISAKQKIVKQGDKGSDMFVSKVGTFKILVKGKAVGEFSDIRVFGELAILYNPKRLATIQAVTDGAVWVLSREVYQQIVISSNLKEQDEKLSFLRNVEYLNVVDEQVLRQVSNLLIPEFFPPSTVIVRQGDKGDKFYIIRAGTVTVTKTGEGVLGKLGRGQCFGEMALQKEDTRQATVTAEAPGVECLTLTRAVFINHFGDVEIPKIEVKKPTFKDEAEAEYQDISLSDFKIIKTLGVGGFGRVELVHHKKKKNLVFALKYLKKAEIVHMQQQKHVYNEKIIQMNCKSPFIVRLYRTYKDNKYVYFLMESCLGGDLFSLIHKQKGKRFDEKDAKFYSACVLEAFEYLHSRGIIYRDLKPENLMVDKLGYLKLTDFGFAKRMPARGKTFTFAGTPEYVAPEIVLNRGHDKSVDYWAFGVFVFELLTGKTPFKTGDSSHMRTYNKILNGIIKFPPHVSPKASNLIEKLCRPGPAERLGMQKGGTRDIKLHKWYQDFEWTKFVQRQLQAPIKPKIKDTLDTSNFEDFKPDKDIPPAETSGWDINF